VAGGWLKVQCCFDNYEGWITNTHITTESYTNNWNYKLTSEWTNTVLLNNTVMQVPFAAHIPEDTLALNTYKNTWDFSETQLVNIDEASPEGLLSIAMLYLNTPYLWGGKSVYGIDCSGLVQQVFKWANLQLPRDAWQQAETGTVLHFLQEVRFGDVAFFDNEEGRITHTGILLNDNSILHASSKVRVDAIDTDGIVNSDTGLRTHHLRIIKRLL
jgi:gamma-D-glutamyl-L-lysine dipeptidyl-peptidase